MRSKYLLVDKSILPDYYEKVIEARTLISSGKAADVSEAVKMVGISRKLSIPIYLQVPANHNDAFEYIQLPQD